MRRTYYAWHQNTKALKCCYTGLKLWLQRPRPQPNSTLEAIMSLSQKTPTSISHKARNMWRERFIESRRRSFNFPDLYSLWDKGYNSSDYEPLNTWRRNDSENYFVWMDQFCGYLDISTEESLYALYKEGPYFSFLGRIIYEYLRAETMRPYMIIQSDVERLRSCPEFPDNLELAKGRCQKKFGTGVMNWMTLGLVNYVQGECGHPHYVHLAQLLNHGL